MKDRILSVYLNQVDVLDTNEYFRFALIAKQIDDYKIYMIVRMVHPTKPNLNSDGKELKDKDWKHMIPIYIKGSDDYEFISDIYYKLCSMPLDFDE